MKGGTLQDDFKSVVFPLSDTCQSSILFLEFLLTIWELSEAFR